MERSIKRTEVKCSQSNRSDQLGSVIKRPKMKTNELKMNQNSNEIFAQIVAKMIEKQIWCNQWLVIKDQTDSNSFAHTHVKSYWIDWFDLFPLLRWKQKLEYYRNWFVSMDKQIKVTHRVDLIPRFQVCYLAWPWLNHQKVNFKEVDLANWLHSCSSSVLLSLQSLSCPEPIAVRQAFTLPMDSFCVDVLSFDQPFDGTRKQKVGYSCIKPNQPQNNQRIVKS